MFLLQVQQVLKIAEMCRKLETEEEKVLPFYSSSLSSKEEEEVRKELSAPLSEPWVEVRRSPVCPEFLGLMFKKV